MAHADKKSLNILGLVAVTYGLVILTVVIAAASYFYSKSRQAPGAQSEPDPTRRIFVGAVWVPVYPGAQYYQPTSVQQGAITNGTVKFKTSDPAGGVLGFYESSLKQTGYFTTISGAAGGTVQGVRNGGRTSVLVSVSTSGPETLGEIRTMFHNVEKEKAPFRSP